MENHLYKSTGIALISGSLLIIVTMVLHPAGGSIEHIMEIANMITIAHSLAIISLPIILFGCYGLSIKLLDQYRISTLAFIIMAFGLIAAMFAALVNGLTLPYFLSQYSENIDQNVDVLKPIMSYGFALNKPLDYIFIVACCLSVFIWSLIIVLAGKFPRWIGYFGVLLIGFTVLGAVTGFVFTSLWGFRLFTFSLAGWILSVGFLMSKTKNS